LLQERWLESRLELGRLVIVRVHMWMRTPFRDIAILHMRSLCSLPSSEASFVEPMECLAAAQLPDGPEWVYEVKLDGYRALRSTPTASSVSTLEGGSARRA
jgi:hypothetical protein